MDKTQTWYGYLLADGMLRCERLLAGGEPREDAVRVYGPIEARSRLLAYRDLKVMHAAADPMITETEVGRGSLEAGIGVVVSQYARIVGRGDACALLAGLLVQLSDGGDYEVMGGRVTIELGDSVVDMPIIENKDDDSALPSSICSMVAK